MRAKNKIRSTHVYFWYSASEVWGGRFIRFQRGRLNDGTNSNRIVPCAIIYCPLIAGLNKQRDAKRHNLAKNQILIRGYNPLYRSFRDAYRHRNEIKYRPDVNRLKRRALRWS